MRPSQPVVPETLDTDGTVGPVSRPGGLQRGAASRAATWARMLVLCWCGTVLAAPDTAVKVRQACLRADAAAVKQLLEEDPACIEAQDEDARSVLHAAAEGGSPKIIKLLIKEGLDVNARDVYGLTPLHYAARNGHGDAAVLLVDKGADINAISVEGMNPLHVAREWRHEHIVHMLLGLGGSPRPPTFSTFEGRYLGQDPPDTAPILFAPGAMSSLVMPETSCVFSPDGTAVYWSRRTALLPGEAEGREVIVRMTGADHRWMAPQQVPFSSEFGDGGPSLSPDGKRMFFLSERPLPNETERSVVPRVWQVDAYDSWWGEPRLVGEAVNATRPRDAVSPAEDLSLYFSALGPDGSGDSDIYRSELVDNQYSAPVALDEAVNTDLAESTPFTAPDQSYLVFSRSSEAGTAASRDLFVSFRNEDGTQSPAVRLGHGVNTEGDEAWPRVTPDGKFLFYLGAGRGVYWVDARVIELCRAQDPG